MRGPRPNSQQLGLLEEPQPEKAVNVYLVDEDELLLAGYAHHLGQSPRIDLVRSVHAPCTPEVLTALLAPGPNVLVLGVDTLNSPVLDSIEAAGGQHPGAGVVLLINEIGEGSASALGAFMRRWPSGFACVFKRTIDSSRRLVGLVESVAQGHLSTDASILNRVLGRDRDGGGDWLAQLSPREAEAMELMVEGLSNAAIAGRMHLELKTVERHINGIYTKPGAQSDSSHPRVQAVRAYLSAVTVREGQEAR